MAKNKNNVISDSEGVPWIRALEQARGLPEGSLTPVFKIWGQGSVHESITEAAAKKAGVSYSDDLKNGVRWPDVPPINAEKNDTGYWDSFKLYAKGNLKKPGSQLYDSHYGSKQYWHSMVPSDGKTYTNKEVRELIVKQAVEWYDQALKTHNIFHLGKALHMVQDSYSASHVTRDPKTGGVLNFQSYDKQDEHKHAKADEVPGMLKNWKDIPGTQPALIATTKMLEMYKNKVPSKELANYLRSDVYFFANGNNIHRAVPETEAGGSHPDYLPEPKHKNKPHQRQNQYVEEGNAAPVNQHKHLNMAKAYAELPSQQALTLHPELASLYAARHLVKQHSANNADTLARFDAHAIDNIAQGNLLGLQKNTDPGKSIG